jgi:biopolymer transport protein ExbD
MAMLSASQRARVDRAVRHHQRKEEGDRTGELNVVPFLDIVINVLMFALATMATVFTAEIRPAHAGCCSARRPERETLTVHVVPNGYIVSATSGFAAPGCASLVAGGEVAVPLRLGIHDAEGLRACLVRLKTQTLAAALVGQRRVQVSAVGALPYHELVRALDAVRGTSAGRDDLFPEAALGVVR